MSENSPRPNDAIIARREGSAMVALWRSLPANRTGRFQLPDPLLYLVDVVVAAYAIAVDDSDPRPVPTRLQEDLFPRLEVADWQELVDWAGSVKVDADELPAWLKNMKRETATRFLRRALGAATFHRFEIALQQDRDVVLLALRRGLRSVLVFARALDACVASMSPGQIARFPELAAIQDASTFVGMIISFDQAIDRWRDDETFTIISTRTAENAPLLAEPEVLSETLARQMSEQTVLALRKLSERFVRKIEGAHDVLEFNTADAVSQAANSAIELIDRLLREAIPDADVLTWIDTHAPDRRHELVRSDEEKPTKLGQALCFVHCGGAPEGSYWLHDLCAVAIVAARKGLQALKHADSGAPAERQRLLALLAGVEGCLLLVLRMHWYGSDDLVSEIVRRVAGPPSDDAVGVA